ncbi:MAG: hypothetical protein ACI4QS_10720 [Comamonas sp.]
MSKLARFLPCVLVATAAMLLSACQDDVPQLPWQNVAIDEAKVDVHFPCEPQNAKAHVDFGMDIGMVQVSMVGCDAIDSTYAFSHWLLDDPRLADDALAFWQVAVLNNLKAIDGDQAKSGEPFVPAGALPLSRSIRATVEGIGPAGWTITTHGVWFARQEGEKVRIFHGVIYAPKAHHRTADTFFEHIVLR